ncbi:hypothetical protein F5Y03DRAFT_366102 [Xylaria venustula]|nr:hypothetical protein F5Y03DRAFT_366102 [Xylaria venustula]
MPGVIVEPLAGCIKWLPRKDELKPADSTIDEGCCNHPVVILSTGTHNGIVEILVITSFGGVDLETKFPTENQARRNHLPIAPGRVHPDNGILLYLRDQARDLKKRSYVNTRDKHSILLASLRPYNRRGPEIFLSKRSYKTLVKHSRFTESTDAPLPGALADVYRPSSSSHQYNLGRSISIERSNAEEDMETWSSFLRRTADNSRANVQINAEASRSHPAAHISGITAARPERQQLLPANRDYRSYHYGRSNTLLPTTHPIRNEDASSKPSNWETFWTWVGIVATICLAAAVCYGFYRGGCWVVAALGRALRWIKEGSQSADGMIKSLSSLVSWAMK